MIKRGDNINENPKTNLGLDIPKTPNISIDRIQNIAKIGYWTYHANENLFHTTAKTNTLFGMDPELTTISPIKIFRHIFIKDVSKIRRALLSISKGKNLLEIEFRYTDLHGNIRWVVTNMEIIHTESGSIDHIIGFIRDITLKKYSELTLSEYEAKYRKILDNTSELIAEVDEHECFTFLNNKFQQVIGYSLEELLGKHISLIYHYEDLPLVLKKFELIKKTHTNTKDIWRLRHKNGKYIHFETRSTIFNTTHNQQRIITISTNISETLTDALKLKESEERFRLLSQSTQEAVFISENGYCIETNQMASTMFGFEYSELIGTYGTEFIAPESKIQVEKNMKTGYNKPYEAIGIKKEGTKFPVMFFSGEEFAYKGKTVRYTVCRDLSREKTLQKELIYNKQNLERAEEVASCGNWEFHLSNKMVYVSHGAKIIYGFNTIQSSFTISELQKIPIYKYRKNLDEALTDLIDRNKPYDVVFEIEKQASNSRTYLHSIAQYDKERNVVFGVIQDITEQKKYELELQRIQNELSIKNSISNAFLTHIDESFFSIVLQILQSELKAEFGLFGYLNEDGNLVCPALSSEIWPSNQTVKSGIILPKERWGGMWGDALKSGKIQTRDSAMKFPGGHADLSYAIASPILKGDNSSGLIILARNTHAFSKNEIQLLERYANYIAPLLEGRINEDRYKKQLIKAKEEAELNNRLKTSFLANMSHEVRTPMNAIIGFSEILNDRELGWDQRLEFTKIVVDSSHQLLSIVDDIMEISQLESGNILLEVDALDLSPFLSDLSHQYSVKANQSGLSLIKDTQSGDENITIYTDRKKLCQVLTILLENAIKFTKTGHITYGYRVKGEEIEFFVEDTGIGIDKELHEVIFERFRQAEMDLTRRYGGTGLGLAISKNIVTLLGGKIWLDSTPDKGSTFYFTIPYNQTTY